MEREVGTSLTRETPAYLNLLENGELNRRAQTAAAAMREMHRQVGDLVIGPDGLATRGLLVRHLLMPEGEAETEAILAFLADEISVHTAVNLMAQYHPNDRLFLYPELQRRVSRAEVERAFAAARRVGLSRFV